MWFDRRLGTINNFLKNPKKNFLCKTSTFRMSKKTYLGVPI